MIAIVLLFFLALGTAATPSRRTLRQAREASRSRAGGQGTRTLRQARPASRPRVIGGQETRNRDGTPYVVKVDQGCTGTIIDAYHVVSAAHCFSDRFSQGRQTKFEAMITIAHNVDLDRPHTKSTIPSPFKSPHAIP